MHHRGRVLLVSRRSTSDAATSSPLASPPAAAVLSPLMNSFAQETVDGLADDDADTLLVSGGDGRMAINPETGLNKYGCAPRSRDVLAVGSCTASSPTARYLRRASEP